MKVEKTVKEKLFLQIVKIEEKLELLLKQLKKALAENKLDENKIVNIDDEIAKQRSLLRKYEAKYLNLDKNIEQDFEQ